MMQNIIFTRKTQCFWYNFLYLFKWVWILHHLNTILQLIHCNTWWYIATLLVVCNVQWYKPSFLPAKYHVFDTISCIFLSECGSYDKLIQFYRNRWCNSCFLVYYSANRLRIISIRSALFRNDKKDTICYSQLCPLVGIFFTARHPVGIHSFSK